MRRSPPFLFPTPSVVAFVVEERLNQFGVLDKWEAVVHVRKKVVEIVAWRHEHCSLLSERMGKKRIRKPVKDAQWMWVAMCYLEELIDKAHPIPKDWKPSDDDGEEMPPYPKILWRFVVSGVG